MALVAYDNSDSSEYEDDGNESAPAIVRNHKAATTKDVAQPTTSQTLTNGNDSSPAQAPEGHSLFNLLPSTTKMKTVIEEEDDEFLHKKETPTVKPKAKITVPSLSDFRDVEDRPAIIRPKTSNGKKSGLLSMLPQPKHAGMSTTSLIPNVLKKKPSAPLVPTSVKKKTPLPSPMKKAKTEAMGLDTSYSDDSDNEEEETTDFFSINKPKELAPIETMPLDIDMEPANTVIEKKPSGIESYFKKEVPQHVELQPDYSEHNDNVAEYYGQQSASHSTEYAAAENSGSNNMLDDEAIRQLIGSRAKRKMEDIQIVDVNQQEVLGDSKEWLLKGLMDDTTKRVSSSKKTGNEPSAQQRRKHQITYLAHQAKANESELQNQWANSRMSKRKTQSKYGF